MKTLFQKVAEAEWLDVADDHPIRRGDSHAVHSQAIVNPRLPLTLIKHSSMTHQVRSPISNTVAGQVVGLTLDDGTRIPARLVGADPIFDLAVLRITPPTEERLPTAALGDSDRVRVGDEVLAIGNPIGFDQSLTRGIVSGMNRILPETPFSVQEPLIQTDAPINPGYSGGPLVNMNGEVVGVNTFILSQSGGNEGLGFAIPCATVRTVTRQLEQFGHLRRQEIGVGLQTISPSMATGLALTRNYGVIISDVLPGGPAEAAVLMVIAALKLVAWVSLQSIVIDLVIFKTLTRYWPESAQLISPPAFVAA